MWVLGSSEATVAGAASGLTLAGASACDVTDAAAVDAALDRAAASWAGWTACS